MPFRRIGAGITLVVMLAACGSAAPAGSTPPGATPAPGASATAPAITTPAAVTTPAPVATVAPVAGELDACPLITKEEAAAAIGVAVVRADGAGGGCLYYGEDDAVVLTLGTVNDQYGLAALSTYLDDPANELVPGIGDKTVIYQADAQYAGRSLYSRKGTKGFHIDVLVPDMTDAEAKTALIALATIVAGRI